ncbi:LPS export ABC transporter periplasmic protein LptC [Acetobacter sp. AN02]|uniref:LPS export ABC transporter periplasmic protein LptC n=1 Tax=Acetobacter sp. AN02 TaxID=2894186 RepID=UPI0024342F16|nr:LPS export ABC transporter periplasmic protein LptC [Acetobacter sp. AN02]MDG6094715.1 LPS export ABC transporter periplasmic protein LptC [Acetobacter sp. AN02]
MSGTEDKKSDSPKRADFERSEDQVRRQREVLNTAPAHRARAVLSPRKIAQRQQLLRRAKWILPACALLLLGSVAIWPEVDRILNAHRTILTDAVRLKLESGNLAGAVYRSVDTHDRPYMVTAETAHQVTQDRIDLRKPVADMMMQGDVWMQLLADNGVYMQHEQILDLTGNVTLYRDDGVMMRAPVADVSLQQGIIASDNWIHAEGPFGVLDAKGYWIAQHEGVAQFRGPGRLILNDDRSPSPAAAPASSAQGKAS